MDLEDWTKQFIRHTKDMPGAESVVPVHNEPGVFCVDLEDGTEFFVKVIEVE